MNLYVLWIHSRDSGIDPEPQIFESEGEDPNDHQKDLTTSLDKTEAEWLAKGAATNVSIIHGLSVEPLRKYFQSKERK